MYCAVKKTNNAGNTIIQRMKIISVPAGNIANGEIIVSFSIGQRYKSFVEKFVQNPLRLS